MAVVLSYLGDLPSEQVADILGVSATTVRVYLSHARARLGALLDDGSRE
jgi:DNA-directed RNA polymerase specialized sigma24 family protein